MTGAPREAPADDRPLVFVTVGMEHFRFERLMGWVQGWLERGPERPVRCLVQHGASSAPSLAECVDYMEYADLEATLLEAAAVVCHGGGGTPMMCLWSGRRPILVPRLGRLKEAVDDHQVVFSRKLAAEGKAFDAEDQASFFRILDDVVSGREQTTFPVDRTHVAQTIDRFERLVAPFLPAGVRP